jgi:aminoglycoside 6'-N-acetyltransferase I
VKIREVTAADAPAWLRMRIALWPDSDSDHQDDIERFFDERLERKRTFVAEDDNGELVGFLELDQRSYAPGCTSSPVPFIEGWYVDPDARRSGVGRELIRAAEDWSRAAGFTEIGSDVEIDNVDGLVAHEALGYEETDRVVSFRRSLFSSAVILAVAEAEPLVGELRKHYTPGGVRGIPAHVTLLHPFADADQLDDDCIEELRGAIDGFGSFDFTLANTARFDDGVLYVAVEPMEPFRALIARICDAFPGRKPYERFAPDEVIPHLTVVTAEGYPNGPTSGDLEVFDRVEAQLAPSLPLVCRAHAVVVLADSPDGYSTAYELPLG